ncbi:MAG: transporter substrate-binding domain-containing protein [Lachnospiraceae bacterium]
MRGIYMEKQCKRRGMLFVAVTVALMVTATGCTRENGDDASKIVQGQSDLEYVQAKGTLVVGVTDFAPMDYHSGEDWAGFDANLAKAFAESIGVTVELTEIDWDKKTELLTQGSIDCIWNAMTVTEELQETISCSNPYLSNAQVIVLQNDKVEQYDTIESCQHLLFAVEAGSTGESLLDEMNYRFSIYPTQVEALQSVSTKKADAAVIDIIMAAYYAGDGQEFDNLGFTVALNDEKICVGFRKDSDLTEKANEFLQAAYEDGTISALASRYGIENAVLDLADKSFER